MVQIHLKQSDEDQFLFEVPAVSSMDDVIRQIAEVHNLRLKLRRLTTAAEELAKYGPMKPEEQRGLEDDIADKLKIEEGEESESGKGKQIVSTTNVKRNIDPTQQRTGYPPEDSAAETIQKTVSDAKAIISKDMPQQRRVLTMAMLEGALANIKGAVTIAYPMGLPEYDVVRQILDGTENLQQHPHKLLIMDPAEATMWWAGKQLHREKKLSDFVGRNEKTKIVAKLQKKGQGPPAREPAMDPETQKEMLAYWYKKQEEHKALMADDEDSYLNSAWADPRSLKNHFTGTSNITWRPGK
eukprot:GEZU01003347.1.p1 GENE.GEZU01003347.1~~GEZU01003347.1.p1  ORF type:complete len:298 (-),score=75.85 GEZU01003347.1:211-1104(-)